MARTILVYARSGAGKTTLLGEMAEWIYRTTGKRTRIYTADKGGTEPIKPYVDLGIVDLIEQGESSAFIFLNKAAHGYVRDEKGKWVAGKLEDIGLVAFESLTSFADGLMAEMAKKASEGTSIGGGANISFTVQGDGESLKIGGSNMAMYGVCQNRITDEVWASQKLPVPYLIWTASVSRDEDPNASGKVLGPQVVGKALTAEVPRWFSLTFRLDVVPAQMGKPERHILYLGQSVDLNAGNATSLGNVRTPLGSQQLPPTIEPASLVRALDLIDSSQAKAVEEIKKRLGK